MKIKSKYVGVSWEKDRQKWKAQIDIRNNKKNLGRFDSEIQAEKKYDEYAKELDKPLNFPNESNSKAKKRKFSDLNK